MRTRFRLRSDISLSFYFKVMARAASVAAVLFMGVIPSVAMANPTPCRDNLDKVSLSYRSKLALLEKYESQIIDLIKRGSLSESILEKAAVYQTVSERTGQEVFFITVVNGYLHYFTKGRIIPKKDYGNLSSNWSYFTEKYGRKFYLSDSTLITVTNSSELTIGDKTPTPKDVVRKLKDKLKQNISSKVLQGDQSPNELE